MKVDVLLGLQWGDEGKGKIVDVLTPKYDIIARFQGGPNAGHTLKINGLTHILHIIPSGIFHADKINVIGNGVIIDPKILLSEIKGLREKGVEPKNNLKISKRANLILPTHRMLDAANESDMGAGKIGSTLKGIGPCYTDKVARYGLRIGDMQAADFKERYNKLKNKHLRMLSLYDNFNVAEQLIDKMPFEEYEKLWFSAVEELKNFDLIDSELYINKALEQGKAILAEGAQGTMLDIDFGSYPFVTSSNTITAGVCSGLGIAPSKIGKVFGVFKAYCTRVGSGPFPTELFDETGNKLRKNGNEFGSTTGRPRRCGWLDLPALRYAIMLNGVTDLVMMKADVINDFETVDVCTGYNIKGKVIEDIAYEIMFEQPKPVYATHNGWNKDLNDIDSYSKLPEQMRAYIDFIEKNIKLPVAILSIGPGREQTIEL